MTLLRHKLKRLNIRASTSLSTNVTLTRLVILQRCFLRKIRSTTTLNMAVPFTSGLVARMKGDAAGARAAFTAARAQEEAEARVRPNFGTILSGLGLVDAG